MTELMSFLVPSGSGMALGLMLLTLLGMIIDSELLWADGTWAPTATGDNISPNVTDLGPLGTPIGPGSSANLGRDLGEGATMWFIVTVKTAVTSAGAATVDFRLRTAANAALTTTPIDVVSSTAIAKATLVAGFTVMIPFGAMSVGTAGWQRFVGCDAVIGTAVLTAGAFHVTALKDEQKKQLYGAGFTLDV
jgi:hypothetical protein